jgi:hypothetical protein
VTEAFRHDGRTLGDAGEDRVPRGFEAVDDVDPESVLLERDGRQVTRRASVVSIDLSAIAFA